MHRPRLAFLVLCLLCVSFSAMAPAIAADEPAKAPPAPVPAAVPVSMHDFMEGVFQAPYRRLKVAMAEEPKEAAGWKAIRSDSLILAEGGNLLLLRLPEKDADSWTAHSVDTRNAGAELVTAAKAKNFAEARKAYETMLNHCNACHRQFENGKHSLAP